MATRPTRFEHNRYVGDKRKQIVYDLDAPEWSSTLTAGQLRNGFARRLNAELDEDGRRVLRTFIEGELALR